MKGKSLVEMMSSAYSMKNTKLVILCVNGNTCSPHNDSDYYRVRLIYDIILTVIVELERFADRSEVTEKNQEQSL